jgi:hypothetical protein
MWQALRELRNRTSHAQAAEILLPGHAVSVLAATAEIINNLFASSDQRFAARPFVSVKNEVVQVFALSYRCQPCKGPPEVFLVRRHGMKLALAGRAPIEHTAVPGYIPKTVRHFYSGAVVAHQSGQTLAGLFLLRIVIEQFAYASTGVRNRADDALEAYMAALPGDFKNRFTSLKSLYEKLSADIHAAAGSAELFKESAKAIAEHFDARRLFRIRGSTSS